MKSMFTLLLTCLCFISYGRPSTFDKLSEVNKCWRALKDLPQAISAPAKDMDERSWIALHLSLVEEILRSRSTESLSPQQAAKRAECLRNLNEYWHAGRFPINEDYSYRTPIFIDKYDNFCAVGYLVKASGNERIARKIAARTNLAYVKDMNYPELNAWAVEHGFTTDELAWIQPGYPPAHYAEPVGKGVEGEVRELFADNADGKLYVGGSFIKADSTITANNIAYVTEQNGVYTWHNMGSGVNGPVNAIVKHQGKIYVAGHFSMAGSVAVNNVASWDGSSWAAVGCTYGTIHDLAVMNGDLYAAGEFDVCAALSEVNFARWNDTVWQQMYGLDGKVNTLHVMDTTLVIGGLFTYQNNALNVIKWSRNAGFTPFAGSIENEVNDFELFNDTLYAACTHTSATDSLNLMVRMVNDRWVPLRNSAMLYNFVSVGAPISFNTLCTDGNQLMLGGGFNYLPMVGTFGSNAMDMSPSVAGVGGRWFTVDSTINKMVVFKNSLIAGGKFKKGQGQSQWGGNAITLNGMVKRGILPTSIPAVNRPSGSIDLYPNPLAGNGTLTLKNDFNASQFVIRDLTGKTIFNGTLKAQSIQQKISLPALSSGFYLLEATNSKHEKGIKRFVVE